MPARAVLVYFCAFISLATGTGLLWQRTAALAARVLLCCLLFWLLAWRVPRLFPLPTVETSWSASETAVMVAAAWVLDTWLAADWDTQRFGLATGGTGLRIARVLCGLAFIPFGLAHFLYLKNTVTLVPKWLPWHTFWAYFTGCALLAAGVAMVLGIWAKLAAVLAAVEIGLFTLLVWVPIMAAGSKDTYQWSETIVSAALTAGAWVVADSYRGMPWFAVNKR